MKTEFIKNYVSTVASFNRNVRLLLLRTIAMGLYAGIHGLIFNFYILEMGYKTDFLGLLLSISLMASSAMSIPAGVLCDRFDRRKLLIISSVLAMAATLPVFLLRDPAVMLLFSAAGGIFGSVSAVCLTPILSDNCDRNGTVHVFSANASLGWIASVIGCALGGVLPGLMIAHLPIGRSGYQLTLLASMTLLAISCMFALLLKKGRTCADPSPITKPHKPKFRFSLKDLRPSPTVLKFTLTSVTFGVASGMIVPYFNVYFMKVLHMDVFQIGVISAAAGAFMLVGFIITPYLTAHIGKVRSAVFTKLISAPFVVLMAFTKDFVIAAGAYVVYMFLINMAGPATTSFQMEQIKKHEQGFAVGLMSTGSCLAVSASSFISGLLISHGNYTVPFILTCAGYIATAVLLYHYFKDVEAVPLLRPLAKAIAD